MSSPEIAIVGAGPVGLLLALRALEEDLAPIVIERRRGPRSGSRSIGIHPPSLEILARLGLAERFLERGVRVRRGIAVGEDGAIGTIAFDGLPGAHRYVLTVPQEDTEAILAEALRERAPGALLQGAEVIGVEREGARVIARLREDGRERARPFAALVACDGKHSAVRSSLGIAFDGGAYEGAYAMADFPDTTGYGHDAAVFLTRDGLVESFPLPGGIRRWVLRRARDEGDPDADEIVETVRRRTGHALPASEARAPSGFRAERYIARALSSGPVALAGDAAHVVSPIGGQGMNLGWLGASRLATMLGRALREDRDPSRALALDAAFRRREARAAARRAEMNMWLGRPTPRPDRRERVVRALLAPPCAGVLARMFTMRGLFAGI